MRHEVKNLLLWWHLTAFLTTAIDPSHSLGMTINISLIMTSCRLPSFWTEARMLCGKDGKRNNGTEWRIYYSVDVLPAFLITQRILRQCPRWHFTTFRTTAAYPLYGSECLLTVPVILNGGKNALWEKQETEQWHGVMNLLHPWLSIRFFEVA